MTNSLPGRLSELKKQLLDSVLKTPYSTQETSRISTRSTLESLLSPESYIHSFALACALLSSSRSSTHELLAWIPDHLATAAETAFSDLLKACNNAAWVGEKRKLIAELFPVIAPVLNDKIKESSIDKSDETDEFSAASTRAILAANQFRWFVCQIEYPDLDKMMNFVIHCALTCLDHWSPEVKGQGMISFIHAAKNVNTGAFDLYGDMILDACCWNIASTDAIWKYVVEMSVLLVTCIHRDNPRSLWFQKILTEMLIHLERQPWNRERRIAWLTLIDPIFNSMRLLIVAYIELIFPLLFQWLHVDDDETVLMALKRLHTIVRLTWLEKSPYLERLVKELAVSYKKAAMRKAREEIRSSILNLLIMLQQYKGIQFERAWIKHSDDPYLTTLDRNLSVSRDYYLVSNRSEFFQPLRIDGMKPKEGSKLKEKETESKPGKMKMNN
ncbi:hypothetical protein F3Y22_tig00010533pilonHSYRG00215 [Hibiscus syriacus]|uniref:Uncharacterized protein n=1 Tax=Hibiscus syriacus TaxID=106335 RepID=A0A6A3C567_HIBSY|nr:uncharacterized protein At2g39910-like [Hibiscus syriacus]KAE8724345.1 hypothetical protein F3Y22_tig00010533pilonHSYRG00215 [Hibiscus syriacus]